jgi:hypothetical protein
MAKVVQPEVVFRSTSGRRNMEEMVEDQVPREFPGRAEPGNRSKLLLQSDRFVWQTGCQNRQKSTKSDLHGTLKPEMLRVLNSDSVQTLPEVAPSKDAWAQEMAAPCF